MLNKNILNIFGANLALGSVLIKCSHSTLSVEELWNDQR